MNFYSNILHVSSTHTVNIFFSNLFRINKLINKNYPSNKIFVNVHILGQKNLRSYDNLS